MLAVKDELGDRFTISVETTYRTVIRFILTQMYNEVESYQSQDDKLPVSLTNAKPPLATSITEVMLLSPFLLVRLSVSITAEKMLLINLHGIFGRIGLGRRHGR